MAHHHGASLIMEEHRARKRFGQNFLVDPNIIRKIVRRSTRSPVSSWWRSAPAGRA
jgi:hypothetical protein